MLDTILQLGALYALVSLSVCVSFRFLRFPDLTIDGSFILGASISARAIVGGWGCWHALIFSVLGGAAAGLGTAALHRWAGINKFFAGVLSAMILYSVNLRILGGANLATIRFPSVFGDLNDLWVTISCLSWLAGSMTLLLVIFHSRLGLTMRALGGNEGALKFSELKKLVVLSGGMAIANALASLAGALLSQYQGFADVNSGIGIAIGGFAGLFVGEALVISFLWLFGRKPLANFRRWTESPASSWPVRGELVAGGLGAFAVTAFTVFTLSAGLPPSDNKFVNAVFLLLGMFVRRRGQSQLLVPRSTLE